MPDATCTRCRTPIADGDPHVRAGEIVVCIGCLSRDERTRLVAGRSRSRTKRQRGTERSGPSADSATPSPTGATTAKPSRPKSASPSATRPRPDGDIPLSPTPGAPADPPSKVPHRHGSLVIEASDGITLNAPLPLEAAPDGPTLESTLVPCDVCGRRMAAAHAVCADCGYDRREGLHTSRLVELGGISADDLTCDECGYLLRGIASARCPECGTAFSRRRRSRAGIYDGSHFEDETRTYAIAGGVLLGVGLVLSLLTGGIIGLVGSLAITVVIFIAAVAVTVVMQILGAPIAEDLREVVITCALATAVGVGTEFVVPCIPLVGAVTYGIVIARQFGIGAGWAILHTLAVWISAVVAVVAAAYAVGTI